MSEIDISVSQEHFGEHLTLDGYYGSMMLLNSDKVVFEAINNLPEILGMKNFPSRKFILQKEII